MKKQKQSLRYGGSYKNIAVINYCVLMSSNKDKLEQTASILQMFKGTSNHIRKQIKKLEQESSQKLGSTHFLLYKAEWIQLSSKLSKLSDSRKLKCLKDRNHRLLMIQFVRHRAVNLYNLSYFNGAKISDHYITFLCSQDPYFFTEILVIVNKLKLIHKHYSSNSQNQRYGENHINIKIMKILELCQSGKKKINLNLDKFKAITQFQEDRYELTLELGKMLRRAWALEKQDALKKNLQVQMSYISPQNSFFHIRDQIEEIGCGQDSECRLSFQLYAKIPFKGFVRDSSQASMIII